MQNRGVHRRWASRWRLVGQSIQSPPPDRNLTEICSGVIRNVTWPFGTRIDSLLRSVGKTVGLVLLQHAMNLERLQTRHADVTGVFVSIRDASREVLDPHVMVRSAIRRI